jgi:hypothetical protein
VAKNRARWLRILCVIAFYALLVYAGQIASDWALDRLEIDLRPSKQAMFHHMVMTAAALYILLLALPFMPGIEIGLGLMVMLGPQICLLVYLSTVIALILAFAVGRLVPTQRIAAAFGWLGLKRAHDMVAQIDPMPADERLAFLMSNVPTRFLSFLLRHRYIALALALNVPGNAFIGGGGGIALAAGMSRLFSFPAYFITVALAVSPFPIFFYLTGGFR